MEAMDAVGFARELIRFDSTCHGSNAAISDYVEQRFEELGCVTERIEYADEAGHRKVNVLGRMGPAGPGGLAYFGHTDVVVSDDWAISAHGPFDPVVRDGRLYGRGSTDMKGSIACMLAAAASAQGEAFTAPLYLSCSSDEEIDHRGAIEIAARSRLYRELVAGGALGIVGEPTRLDVVYAHKGGCQLVVTSRGRAAHSSTREGINANLAMVPFLQEVKAVHDETESDICWHDAQFAPPTVCLNFGINDHNRAINITAPTSICVIGFRPMPRTDTDGIVERLRGRAAALGLEFELRRFNPAFWRDPQSKFIQECVALSGCGAPRTVGYGSEASNFTDVERLLVLGPGDIAQAHKSDEWISLEQLRRGQELYRKLLTRHCLQPQVPPGPSSS